LSVEARVARALAHWDEHGFGQWSSSFSMRPTLIGVGGLGVVSYEAAFTPAVEVAWRLARRYWGLGYATEAARTALDYGFGKHGLRNV